jgi:D-amino-acid dehydrogenase
MAEVVVLGAGIVGVCTALALQQRGHDVCLVDRKAPGQETSFGNAGVIQAEAREPYAFPRAPLDLFKYATGISNDVIFDLKAMPGMGRALWQYFQKSSPRSHAQIAQQYSALIARATADHQDLITRSKADHLVRKSGLGEVYSSAKHFEQRAQSASDFASRYGLRLRVLDGKALAQAEPMTGHPAGAVIWDDSWSVRDPGALVQAYAELFQTYGGAVHTAGIEGLDTAAQGWRVKTQQGEITAQHVVVAMGPWSPELVRPLGYAIQMVKKRGYHAHFPTAQELSRPYLFADQGLVLSSMNSGLRVTTGAHLAQMTAPRNLRQLRRGVAALGEMVHLGDVMDDSEWFGTRPCLPGMLPMITRAKNHAGLWFNFGHGHQGLTLGPTSAQILADQIDSA